MDYEKKYASTDVDGEGPDGPVGTPPVEPCLPRVNGDEEIEPLSEEKKE